MMDFWLEQQPILTDDEKKVELERLDKNADWVLKSGIGVNLDSIY